ncbi:MAG: AtpZ/AtpI family protein [Actinobacteria bacterium]|nr:AtpZ/AtpI family protein [Actinomycetota bacterium]
MAERPGRPGPAARPTAAQDGRDTGASASLPGRIAAAGRWVREPGAGPRWEDLLSEFLSAMLVWAGIGWLVDRWLGTDPWFLVFGVLLGNGLGIYLMWLRSDPDRGVAEAGDGSPPAGRRGPGGGGTT